MSYYAWKNEKNERLRHERGIGFEQIVMHIDRGDVIEIVTHPNKKKYPNQKMLIVKVNDYAYLVPFVQTEKEVFLKTIIPSRKATHEYLRGNK